MTTQFTASEKYLKFKNKVAEKVSFSPESSGYQQFTNKTNSTGSPLGSGKGGISSSKDNTTTGTTKPGMDLSGKSPNSQGTHPGDIVTQMQDFIDGEIKKKEFPEGDYRGEEAYRNKMKSLQKSHNKALQKEQEALDASKKFGYDKDGNPTFTNAVTRNIIP
jgi:hypothetical protein